jgi:Mg-chelatase subunit ChlD
LKRFLQHPLAIPFWLLFSGLLAAFLLSRAYPVVDPLRLELAPWLAQRLSESGDTTLVITRPAALWLLPIAFFPFLFAMAWRSLVDLRPIQIAAQTLARAALLMGLALVLAQPTLRAPIRGKSVVIAVDTSRSVGAEQLVAAEKIIARARELRDELNPADLPREDRTRLSVVRYAQGARALDIPEAGIALSLPREEGSDLASEHAAGLHLAEALIDPQSEGRVVILTDGAGDLAERQGLARAIAGLRERDVSVHLRALESPESQDVLVEAVHLPDDLRVGQSFEVAVDLLATTEGTVKLRLFENGKPNTLMPVQEVQLRGGRQQIKMEARVSEPGPVLYTAQIDPESLPAELAKVTDNDGASAIGEVRGRPRVLHIGSDPTSALPRALAADHLKVDNVGPSDIPLSAEALRKWDLVVLSDVPARAVSTDRQRALVSYVKDHGGGFIMIGGENAFGVGGWGGSAIEQILPVRYSGERQKEQPTLALLLVIDKSGSMSSEEKLDLVKEAARATARTLDPSDEIGVIAFDSAPQVLVRLQPAANRLRISSSIRRLSAGGGTNALPALREAYLQLAGSKALVKHVILLSDGQSSEAGVSALISDMRNADITVSAVGVGAGAGKDFLARVAERGRGRYYFSHDGTDVPRIFSREAREVTRNAIVERLLYPRVSKSAQALRGIDFRRAPGLRGIVPVRPKAQTETLLTTDRGDPLLVRGRRGLGRVAAFASDAKPRWAASWMTWGGFAKLWSQIARDTMRQGAGNLGGAIAKVSPAARAGAWQVVVDVESPVGFANELEGEVEIYDPSREGHEDARRDIPLELTAPGRYSATVNEVTTGQRLLKARLYDASQNPRRLAAESMTSVSIPYPAELTPAHLQVDEGFLAALASAEGLPSEAASYHVEAGIDEIMRAPGDAQGRERAKPLWPEVLLWIVLPLFILDLLLRRVSFGLRRVQV